MTCRGESNPYKTIQILAHIYTEFNVTLYIVSLRGFWI